MGSWITQPGYPILNVNVANDRKRIRVTQKRFLQNNQNHQDNTLWHIPVTYASGKENSEFTDTRPIILLTNQTVEINLKEPADWIIFNVQQTGTVTPYSVWWETWWCSYFYVTGYYRVNYDDKTWSAIADVLHKSHDSIHVLNRAQVSITWMSDSGSQFVNQFRFISIQTTTTTKTPR